MDNPGKFEQAFFDFDPAYVSKDDSFDYIVIGAGLGGGLLATTLAKKNQECSLLKEEAYYLVPIVLILRENMLTSKVVKAKVKITM